MIISTINKLNVTFVLILSFWAVNTNGQTGRLAYAYPLEGIIIDGDLSDWPLNFESYPINGVESELWGDEPESIKDLESKFMVGYDAKKNVIYVAITVRDNSLLINNSENSDFNTHDGTEIYIDEVHNRKGSPVISQGVYGQRRVCYGHKAQIDKATYGFKNLNSTSVYEWQINLSRDIQAGESIGFDIGVFDKDQDGSFSFIAWGKETAKVNSFNRLGDLLLVEDSTKFGLVYGRIYNDSISKKELPSFVDLIAYNNPLFWTQAKIDSNGVYQKMLPEGQYQITPASNAKLKIDEDQSTTVNVKPKRIVQAQPIEVIRKKKPVFLTENGVLKNSFDLDNKKIEEVILSYMDYYDIPGLSISVIKNNEIEYSDVFGVKMVGYEDKVEHNTLFEAASLTKPMFSYLVNRLVDQGIIELDKPLYLYLPYKDIEHDERYKLITARIVLSHKTGFPNWRSENADRKLNIKFNPGSQYGYSGEGFEYLKKVICHLTKTDIETLFQHEVFDILGIENAQISWSNKDDLSLTSIPHTDGRTPIPKRIWNTPLVAASLHIDSKNYAKFILGLMQGTGLSDSRHSDMLKIHTYPSEGSADSPVGLGVFVMKSSGNTYYGHGGANHGFTSNAVFFTKEGIGYVFLVNNQYASKIDKELFKYLISGTNN